LKVDVKKHPDPSVVHLPVSLTAPREPSPAL
jgi:hypothetical protein